MMTVSRQTSSDSRTSSQYGAKPDPRIEAELEKLNKAVAEVNFYDGQLFETKMKFRRSLTDSRKKLDKLYRSQKKWIERSRPYYELRAKLDELKVKLRNLELQYDRVRLDFQDARDNELAAQRALVLLATRDSTPKSSPRSRQASPTESPRSSQTSPTCSTRSEQTSPRRSSKEAIGQDIKTLSHLLRKQQSDDGAVDEDADFDTSINIQENGTLCDVDLDASADGDAPVVSTVIDYSDCVNNNDDNVTNQMNNAPTSGDTASNDSMENSTDGNQSDLTVDGQLNSTIDNQSNVENDNVEAPPGDLKRISVEDGPEGEDVMENWNKATQKVMEFAKMKSLVAEQVEHRMKQISDCQDKMDDMRLTMIKATDKARPYYALRESMETQFDRKLSEVLACGRQLTEAKETYKNALRQLDVISAEIEQRRHLNDLRRGVNTSSLSSNMSHFEELDHIPDYGINTAVSTTLEPAAPPTPNVPTDQELVLSPKIKDMTLHPASPDDPDDNASGMHRSMSLMELSTRIWDTEATTYSKGTGSVSKFTTDTLPTPSELNVNDTTVTTSGDHDLLESPSLSPSSQQYTVSFHMHI